MVSNDDVVRVWVLSEIERIDKIPEHNRSPFTKRYLKALRRRLRELNRQEVGDDRIRIACDE